ncbi:uncharacterized protein AMSG_06892 [Thecamonas trahens ATCC 50062]|uniref:Uncharacterized protein n=1 Tax=Thecamonas trahens ATCC 50062 TaxID=461836 RepID=A0A0L0DE18_THETB|nr:hypothetical protein AMSG_06892 [Thecamonas trahens ATCC 50062]KNC50401.1 hypothetical protein AMSG_06892 [Thecamonas trahens ATCC 50062]|eukprot:XP_013756943.1 hypothetical protein AMSG_06892 [Thecamonas trahens ATCC 50062]
MSTAAHRVEVACAEQVGQVPACGTMVVGDDVKASLTSTELMAWITACDALGGLVLDETEAIDADELLPHIATAAPDLHSLSLSWCSSWVTSDALTAGIAALTRLVELNVSVVRAIDDALLAKLPVIAPGLKVLNVGGCPSVTMVGIASVVVGCPALEELVWGDEDDPDDAPKLVAVAKLLACAQSEWAAVDLSQTELLTDAALGVILAHNGLAAGVKDLVLRGCVSPQLTGAPLLGHLSMPQLDVFDAGDVGLQSAALVAVISAAPALTELHLDACLGATDDVLAAVIAGCSHLTSLSLAHCASLTPPALAMLGALTSLTELDISHTAADDAVLAALAPLTELRALYASCCTSITSAGLASLHVSVLDVSGCPGIERVPPRPTLSVLDIGGTSIDSLDRLAGISADSLLVVVTPPANRTDSLFDDPAPASALA